MSGSTDFERSVLVIGGSGRVGGQLAKRFLADGWEVRVVDLVPPGSRAAADTTEGGYGLFPTENDDFSYVRADMTDLGQAIGAISGWKNVIHTAGHTPRPTPTHQKLYQDNVIMDFNVFEAARITGARRVLWASSSHAGGQPWNSQVHPSVIPIDEDAPYLTGDTYGLAKATTEAHVRNTRYFAPLELVALRVGFQAEIENYPFLYDVMIPAAQGDPAHNFRSGLWNYVDGRDVYQAFRKALETPKNIGGSVINIHAADTMLDIPTREAIASYAPGVPVSDDLPEYGGTYSIARARDLLGYEPEYSWRDVMGSR